MSHGKSIYLKVSNWNHDPPHKESFVKMHHLFVQGFFDLIKSLQSLNRRLTAILWLTDGREHSAGSQENRVLSLDVVQLTLSI